MTVNGKVIYVYYRIIVVSIVIIIIIIGMRKPIGA